MISRFAPEQLARISSMLFTTAAEGLVVVDLEGRICLQNPRMAALFGYGPDELVGRPIEILIPEAVRSRHASHRVAYVEHPVERPMGQGFDLMGQHKSGSLFPVEVSLNHFEVDGERFVMGLVTDVTGRRKAEKELQRINQELEQRVEERTADLREAEKNLRSALETEKQLNALKSRFVSMASHEFRTPLSTIMSSVDLIARYAEGQTAEKVEKHVGRIRQKVRELTSMLNDFLSLDKLEQGMVRCSPVDIDVVYLCIELIEELRVLAKSGQEIHFDHTGAGRLVKHDRQMLSNVVSNLLSNAIKYSPEGRRIDLTTTVDDGRLTISVQDQGIGIPFEDQQHLFERFFRAGNVVNVQGTGLGLSIVRRYLDLMGGTIRFVSTPGEGTIFTVELPQNHTDENDPADRG